MSVSINIVYQIWNQNTVILAPENQLENIVYKRVASLSLLHRGLVTPYDVRDLSDCSKPLPDPKLTNRIIEVRSCGIHLWGGFHRNVQYPCHNLIIYQIKITVVSPRGQCVNALSAYCTTNQLVIRPVIDRGHMNTRASLQRRHNGRDSVSNHQPHDCLLNRLFRRRSKKTSKLRVTGLCAGNSPGTGEFPAQMASYAENVSIWWRHHVVTATQYLAIYQGNKVWWQCLVPTSTTRFASDAGYRMAKM